MSWRLYRFFADRYLRQQSRKYGDARVLLLVLAFLRDWAEAHKLDFDAAVVSSRARPSLDDIEVPRTVRKVR